MKDKELNRRTFIKGTIGAGIALTASPLLFACDDPYKAKGLPTAILGKTGVRIPRIAVGLGSRFCEIDSEDEALSLLNYALENGLYYWDTAHIYENKKNGAISEVRIGKILKERRKEVFLSTKVSLRTPDEALAQIEDSLKRLQTDHLDMLKIHSIASMEEVDQLNQKGQLVEILHKLKEQKITRFIGFSGHGNAEAMKTMAERGNFDSMLIAMNYWRGDEEQKREELVIPAALERGMGVMLMKSVRPKETIANVNPTELIRFALSLNGPSGLLLGMETIDVVKLNIELLRNFKPMNAEEKSGMAQSLSPFFRHENLEWLNPTYQDGNWA